MEKKDKPIQLVNPFTYTSFYLMYLTGTVYRNSDLTKNRDDAVYHI